jgi:hypothetical protein
MTRDGVAQIERGALDLRSWPSGGPVAARAHAVDPREPLGVALPLDHPWRANPDVDLAELADDGFITTPATRAPACRRPGCGPASTPGSAAVVQEITDPYMISRSWRRASGWR